MAEQLDLQFIQANAFSKLGRFHLHCSPIDAHKPPPLENMQPRACTNLPACVGMLVC